MKVTKEEIYGYTGSSIFLLSIYFLLHIIVLKTTVKLGEEGVLIHFGNADWSSGFFEPRLESPRNDADDSQQYQPFIPPPETTPAINSKQDAQPLLTQELENTVAIEDDETAEEKAQRAKEEEQQKREDINRQVSNAFSAKTPNQNQQAAASSGSSGSPVASGSSSVSGYGEFNLGGRTLGSGGLPRPAYTVQEEGRIVVNITVNPSGNVIFAEIGKGTNIDNSSLRRSAVEAAKMAKFNSISGNNNQAGTITYKYLLK